MPSGGTRLRPKRVTMVDVAKIAGVSQSTVSFVINNRRDVVVAEKTRQRVLEIAAKLNYQPNRTAQSLRLNQTYVVGVIATGIVAGPYAGGIVTGIQRAAQSEGQLCLVVDVSGGHQPDRDEAVASLISHGVSGIIQASPAPAPVETSRLLGQTRCIFVNCWPTDPSVAEAVVLADEYGGGRVAAEAAFGIGHTDVAFLGGPPDDYACIERRRGFVDAATAAGFDPDSLHQSATAYQISAGYAATIEAYRHRHPTALVCGNDRMAVGALLALHTLRLEVPADVSLVGFDDQPDMAAELQPALTTVRLPHHQMGYEAGQLLLTSSPVARPGGDHSNRIIVPCPLIERDSLGPPPRPLRS